MVINQNGNNNEIDQRFNSEFWAFQKIIMENPETYLTLEGRILYKIVEHGGVCKSQMILSKELNTVIQRISVVCKKMEKKGLICKTRSGNSNAVVINGDIIKQAEKIPRKIITGEE